MPKSSSRRKTAVLTASNQVTARVKGGRLSVISRLRATIGSGVYFDDFNRLGVAANTFSSFGLGHHRQTAVPCTIDCAHGEDHIILRERQRGAGGISHRTC